MPRQFHQLVTSVNFLKKYVILAVTITEVLKIDNVSVGGKKHSSNGRFFDMSVHSFGSIVRLIKLS